MTLNEFRLTQEGYLESKGIKTNDMTWSDVEKIEKEFNIPRKTKSIKGLDNG